MRDYDAILYEEHPTSKTHPRMSRMARAAQFAPFAALVGFEEEIAERRRTTDKCIELDPGEIEELNRRLTFLLNHSACEFFVCYFLPDSRKEGGAYLTVRGTLKRIDTVEGILILKDGTTIPIEEIIKIEVIRNESEK